MTANDLLILVRQRLGDMQKVSFSDDELLYCLNCAMDDLCIDMSQRFDPELVKTMTLTVSGLTMPSDFISWKGQYPLSYTSSNDSLSTTITHSDDTWDDSMTLSYFAYKPHVTVVTDVIPFRTNEHCRLLMLKTLKEIKPNGGATSDNSGADNQNSNGGQAQ
jgi:hypothetical protein